MYLYYGGKSPLKIACVRACVRACVCVRAWGYASASTCWGEIGFVDNGVQLSCILSLLPLLLSYSEVVTQVIVTWWHAAKVDGRLQHASVQRSTGGASKALANSWLMHADSAQTCHLKHQPQQTDGSAQIVPHAPVTAAVASHPGPRVRY